MILHTLVHDPRMCHDRDPRSYLQGQGHSAHIAQIRVRAITPYYHYGFLKYFTQLLSMIQGCHDLDKKSYFIQGKFCPRFIFAPFALWPEAEFKTGLIELFI